MQHPARSRYVGAQQADTGPVGTPRKRVVPRAARCGWPHTWQHHCWLGAGAAPGSPSCLSSTCVFAWARPCLQCASAGGWHVGPFQVHRPRARCCLMRRAAGPTPLLPYTGNRITLAQLSALTSLHSLHSLDLEGNPAAESSTYRAQTFEMLAVLPHFSVVDELNKQGERRFCAPFPLPMMSGSVCAAPLRPSRTPANARHPCQSALSWGGAPTRPAQGRQAVPRSRGVDSPVRWPTFKTCGPTCCPAPCR